MNNNNENVFAYEDIANFVDPLPIRAVEELAYQLGASVKREPKKREGTIIEEDDSYEISLKSAVKEDLDLGGTERLAQKYFLPSYTSLDTVLNCLRNDIVSQLFSFNWASIDAYEKNIRVTKINLPRIDTDAFSLPYVSFFNRLPERGRQTFAEAFGVDMDNLSFCFNEAGLAFLQKKYNLPDATFSDFSFTFEHALGAQIPTQKSWDWIKSNEDIRGRTTHANGLFFQPKPHSVKEVPSYVVDVCNVTRAENEVIRAMNEPHAEFIYAL